MVRDLTEGLFDVAIIIAVPMLLSIQMPAAAKLLHLRSQSLVLVRLQHATSQLADDPPLHCCKPWATGDKSTALA